MAAGEQRIDKWLYFARVVKSRSLAQKLALSGAVRVNREKVQHSARIVRPGDVLTIRLDHAVRVLQVMSPGVRRGPASEAALLYADLSAPLPDLAPAVDDEPENSLSA
ncbi:RNA-binding S4 domain-containing protein [Aureimonas frigidaquae]|uniref:S4 domain-containing protein n=1 Tax=Aureimonas frigidaquae TaxID=424757 RepID=A0A0N7KXU3_9HYPH|nr:RNA-binding S4 domain-containing protein [Aureimonas frigidaquae]BAT27881.1 S4 domain-containing protein [Aureimonas frigidaquae]